MDEFMSAAIAEAELGLREGGIPIGSVLVHQGRIIGRGHNRRVQNGSVVLHGEMDALENAVQSSDLSEPALIQIFDAHRQLIELRAAQKLNAGLLDTDGCVLLGADDLVRRTDGAHPWSGTRNG